MKTKRLTKKIRRLEARLQKGAEKLASLKQKLKAAKRKSAARAREALISDRVAALQKSQQRLMKKTGPEPSGGPSERISFTEVKKKRQITPERRAQLSAAMKARWDAKRAAAATPQDNTPGEGVTSGETPQQ
jgi:hypothetical protein